MQIDTKFVTEPTNTRTRELPAAPIAAALVAVCLFALCVYRAATQSFTMDEAFTWSFIVRGPWSNVFDWTDANNHFLFSLLIRLLTEWFIDAEWVLRLPTLAGAALFLASLYRLAVSFHERGPWPAMFVFMSAANPLVLDYLVAARGYGLALGFLFAAIAIFAQILDRPLTRWEWLGMALACSLSVMSNLSFALPVALLALGATIAGRRQALIWFVPLSAACALLYWFVSPVSRMSRGDFYVGVPSLGESAEVLALYSLAHNNGVFKINRIVLDLFNPLRLLAWGLAPLGGVAALSLVLWRSNRRTRFAAIAAGLATVCWLVLILLHSVFGMPYPFERTGVYFLPLYAMALVGLARDLPRGLNWSALALVFALGANFAVQFQTTHFGSKIFDADTRELLESLHPGKERMRLGVSPPLEFSARYYQSLREWDGLEILSQQPLPPGLDAYLLVSEDSSKLTEFGLSPVARGSISGAYSARTSR